MRSEINFGCFFFFGKICHRTQIKLSIWTLVEIYILFSFLRMWISLFTEPYVSTVSMKLRHLAQAVLHVTIHRYQS